MQKTSKIKAFWAVFARECQRIFTHPVYFFGMIGIPLLCFFFFPILLQQGTANDTPIGCVDLDNSSLSRSLLLKLDAMQKTKIVASYENEAKARKAIQRGEIYGFYYIPRNFSRDVQGQRQPKISFYTNNTFIAPSSLIYRDMKQMSELSSASAAQKTLLAKGATDEKALVRLQPIVIDSHPLRNPWLNYSVYFNNIILPAILSLMIFLMTVYAIGIEIKKDTAREWLKTGNRSITLSLSGKLFPQTLIYCLLGLIYNILLYGFLDFPLNNGIFPMLLGTFFLIIASQAFGIFVFSLFPALRMGLSTASLWGMISLSISGFSFPSVAMLPAIQAVSILFPLRHYYLIYVSQALNGYPMAYAWKHYIALLLFVLLPFLFGQRLKKALIYYKYMP